MQPGPAPVRGLGSGRWLVQLAKFGSVGAAATGVHAGVFAGLIELGHLAPLISNLLAFCVAVGFSFVGHANWTFARDERTDPPAAATSRRFVRFCAVAIAGLGLNTLIVYVVTAVLLASYLYALAIMVAVVPLVLFMLNKSWAFRPAHP